MKKIIFTTTLLFATAFLFQSCDNDDDKNSGSDFNNEVTIDGTFYQLNDSGFLEEYGENEDGSFDWDVELVGPEAYVYLDLNTTSADGLVEGTYTYSNVREAFSFVDAEIGFDDDNYFALEAGTIEIDVDGDTVSIEFTVISSEDGNDTEIECEWSGTFTLGSDGE